MRSSLRMRAPGGPEGGEHAQVGGVAGGEEESGLGALPVGQLGLQLGVDRPGAGHQAGRARARAPPVEGGVGGGDHRRVLGQPEVVVGGERRRRGHVEVAHRPPPAGGRHRAGTRRRPSAAQFMPVGLQRAGQDVDDPLHLGLGDGERGHEHDSLAQRPQEDTGPGGGGAHLPPRSGPPATSTPPISPHRRTSSDAVERADAVVEQPAELVGPGGDVGEHLPLVEETQVAEGHRRGQGVAAERVAVGQVPAPGAEGVGHPAGRRRWPPWPGSRR